MQHFIDTATQRIWSFENNVVPTVHDGIYSFAYPRDSEDGSEPAMIALEEVPTTLQPYVMPDQSPEEIAAKALASAKAKVKASIRGVRDSLLLLTPFSGKAFQSDLASKIQIMNVVDAGSMPDYARYWRTADNTYMEMTFSLFLDLKSAIMAREGAAFSASAMHQDAVDALTTIEAVRAYDYSAGWPTA